MERPRPGHLQEGGLRPGAGTGGRGGARAGRQDHLGRQGQVQVQGQLLPARGRRSTTMRGARVEREGAQVRLHAMSARAGGGRRRPEAGGRRGAQHGGRQARLHLPRRLQGLGQPQQGVPARREVGPGRRPGAPSWTAATRPVLNNGRGPAAGRAHLLRRRGGVLVRRRLPPRHAGRRDADAARAAAAGRAAPSPASASSARRPRAPSGGRVSGYDRTVHAEVEFSC